MLRSREINILDVWRELYEVYVQACNLYHYMNIAQTACVIRLQTVLKCHTQQLHGEAGAIRVHTVESDSILGPRAIL